MKKRLFESFGLAYLERGDYEGLSNFFKDIWKNSPQYEYCVFMARRCFNLNEIFFNAYKEEFVGLDTSKFITNSAILFYTRELSMHYYKSGTIPKLLIVDDMLIHGRTVEKLLSQIERGLKRSLRNLDASEELLQSLHQSLVDAVDIRVYCRSMGYCLLEENYQRKLVGEYRSNHAWREFSQRVSWLIQISDVRNTSFTLSKGIEKRHFYPPDSRGAWHCVKWRLRERELTFYFLNMASNHSVTGQIVFCICMSSSGETILPYMIPFLFAGDLDEMKLSAAIEAICKLCGTRYERIQRILQCTELPEQRAQMFYLICTAAVLSTFRSDFKEVLPNEHLKKADVEKIYRNFSNERELCDELLAISKNKSLLSECILSFPDWFDGIAEINGSDALETMELDVRQRLKLNRKMENYLFSLGMLGEKEAHKAEVEHSVFYSEKRTSDIISMVSFFEDSLSWGYPLYARLCSLIMLSNSGVVTLKPQSTNHGDLDSASARWVLQAGEQALFCKPRQLAIYMPALLSIENQYLQSGRDKVVEQVKSFEEYLRSRNLQLPDQPDDFAGFVEAWYDVGHTLDDWNIFLLYSIDGQELDYLEQTRMNYLKYMKSYQDKIERACAEFLSK